MNGGETLADMEPPTLGYSVTWLLAELAIVVAVGWSTHFLYNKSQEVGCIKSGYTGTRSVAWGHR